MKKDLAAKIVTESCQGVVWLPQNGMIIPQDSNVFEKTFGKVRKVTIQGAISIPKQIEFVGKEWSVEALARPIDQPRVIKLLYLNTRTYKLYSMWWNRGSLINMLAYDRTIVDAHKSEIL